MVTFLFFLPFLLGFVVVGVYGERKVSAFIQNRLGPMEVGPKGILQTIADLLKMLQKEDIIPDRADKLVFLLAPFVVFGSLFAGYAVLPLTEGAAGSGIATGIFFLLAIVSLDVLGILMAGWGSNNKFSVYGAIRSVAQIISYEIPLGISVLCVVMIAQTLDLQEIVVQQGSYTANYLFGISALGVDVSGVNGFLSWNVVRIPLLIPVFLIFFISGLAEANRAPFDLPESESEIIGGYHTEYSGFRFGIFMLAEYGMMLLISFLSAILFFGGWQSPFPNLGTFALYEWTTGPIWGAVWLVAKAMVFIFVIMWIRWTVPRLRVDQLMSLSWKYLTPLALALVFLCAIWRLWVM
ncbi:MAG: complex I subunit 1 family protein [Bacteroidota bacterium]